MATCTFKVKDPKTGKEVESKLFKQLEEHFKNSRKAENVYRNAFLPNFISKFGDWTTDAKAYKLVDEDGNPRLDKYGEPLLQDILDFNTDWEVSQRSHNKGQFSNVLTAEAKRLQKVIDTLSIRLKNLRRVKSTIHTKNKIKFEIKQILDSIAEYNEGHGFMIYMLNAKRDIEATKANLKEWGQDLNPARMQSLKELLDSYHDIAEIIAEASPESSSTKGSKYTLVDSILEEFVALQDDIDSMKNIYHENAMKNVSKTILGNDYMPYIKEYFRRAYMQTPEGKKQKKETVEDYQKRVQRHVEREVENNEYNLGEDREKHVMRMIAIGTDISALERWALNASQTTSPILRALNVAILRAEDRMRLAFNKDVSELDKIFEEYKTYQTSMGKSAGTPLDFYDLIAERQYDETGKLVKKGTGYYTHRWHSSWSKDYMAIKKAMGKIKSEAVLDEVGDIDPTVSVDNKNKKLIHDTLSRLYMLNPSYSEDSSIANHIDRIRDIRSKIQEMKVAIKNYKKLINALNAKEELTEKDIKNRMALEEKSLDAEEKLLDFYSTSSALEKALTEEFREHQDLYHVPNIKNIKKHAANLKRLGIVELSPIENYKSQQYEKLDKIRKEDPKHIVWRYYSTMMNKAQEADSFYGEEFGLGFRMIGRGKVHWERISTDMYGEQGKGIWQGALKPALKQKLQNTKGYDIDSAIQRGEYALTQLSRENYMRVVKTDYKGDQGQYIPIYFRTELDSQDQSMMVHDNILATLYVGHNYHHKNELMPSIEQLLHLIENRDIIQTAGFQQFVREHAGGIAKVVKSVKKGGENLTYEAAKDLIEQRMFGEAIKESGIEVSILGKDISLRKLWDLWINYIGLTLLSGNWMTTVSNLMLGNTLTISESLGGEFFTTGDLTKAHYDYDIDLANIMGDIGRPYSSSKTNLLGILFDPMNDFSLHEHVYAYNNRFKALLRTNSLHGLNGMAEHFMHAIPMYAVLRSVKVMDDKKEYIHDQGKKGEKVTRKTALSLSKAYKRKKSNTPGRHFDLVLPKEVKYIEYRVGETYHVLPFNGVLSKDINVRKVQEAQNNEVIIKLTHIIQAMNESLHGAYSHRNSAPIQRTWYGQALYNMRKFFPVSLVRRWQGFFTALYHIGDHVKNRRKGDDSFFQDAENLTSTSTRYYDPRTGVLRESMYVTTFKFGAYSLYEMKRAMYKFFGSTKEDLKDAKLALIREEWGTMSAHEKANIIRTISELGFALMAYFAAAAIKERGDDDKINYFYEFFLSRLYTELMAYSNPKEMGRLLLSPATTISMIERLYTAFTQMTSDIAEGDFERYQSGRRAGESKLWKATGDIVPWYKAATRHNYVEDILNYHYRD